MRAVILGAGASSRAGRQKLLLMFRGRPLIEYSIEAARRYRPIVVAGAGVAEYLEGRDGVTVIRNDEPARGMSHSLALANASVPPDAPIMVLLADKPLVTATLVETIRASATTSDFAYFARAGEPGHPVVLSPRARERIASLPAGDTLRSLRDAPDLARVAVETHDAGAFFDVDTLADLRA